MEMIEYFIARRIVVDGALHSIAKRHQHRKNEEQGATITALMANDAKQEATIAQQQKQIDTLTAAVQKVSARLEVSKAAPQAVVNNR